MENNFIELTRTDDTKCLINKRNISFIEQLGAGTIIRLNVLYVKKDVSNVMKGATTRDLLSIQVKEDYETIAKELGF